MRRPRPPRRLPAVAAALAAGWLAAALSSTAPAALIATVPSEAVPPGVSTTLALTVSDTTAAKTEDIEGMTFTFQVGSGNAAAPSIQSVNLTSGTVWSGHVSPQNVLTASGGSQPQFVSFTLITDNAGDFVNANGVLATVTLDTTGAAPGSYPLRLIGTKDPGSDSQFINGSGTAVPATFNAGTLLVPEPTGLGLFALAGLAAVARRRRARRPTATNGGG